jgi:Ala-tRNA(Pro) deacylase
MADAPVDAGIEAHEAPLWRALDALGIAHRTVRHPPSHTVEAAKANRGGLAGGHAKNLFLKSKKGELLLVVVQEDRALDVQALAKALGLARMTFASAELMQEWLGVTPGAVTPFGLLVAAAQPDKARLTVVLDEALAQAGTVWFHPLHNAATTGISADGLIAFMTAMGFAPQRLDLGRFARPHQDAPTA